MMTQINTRKVVAIGVMGLLIGSAVIPATVSAAELVTPTQAGKVVTNPGNIVNDDNTFYDKYEWYKGGAMGQPAGFESGHYTKKLDAKAHYTFEVKNETDKAVSFLPAIDELGAQDPVYLSNIEVSSTGGPVQYQGPDWADYSDAPGKIWGVDPHTTKVVTVPSLDKGPFGVRKGLYIYLLGLGNNDSTKGITYRIYQGDKK